jgi:hypothetical protein
VGSHLENGGIGTCSKKESDVKTRRCHSPDVINAAEGGAVQYQCEYESISSEKSYTLLRGGGSRN